MDSDNWDSIVYRSDDPRIYSDSGETAVSENVSVRGRPGVNRPSDALKDSMFPVRRPAIRRTSSGRRLRGPDTTESARIEPGDQAP